MNRSLLEVSGEILAISQFTLLGDTRKGRRPSFIDAADPEKGNTLYDYFIECLKKEGIHVEKGIFGAMMDVQLTNRGPVTLIVESKQQ
jgi:D-tyrosyl-tRNA(Tyr) deacylase